MLDRYGLPLSIASPAAREAASRARELIDWRIDRRPAVPVAGYGA